MTRILLIFLRINRPISFSSAQFCILDCTFCFLESTKLVELYGRDEREDYNEDLWEAELSGESRDRVPGHGIRDQGFNEA